MRSDYVFAHIGYGLNKTTGQLEYRNNLPTSYSYDLDLSAGSYDIKVVAIDEWFAESAIISTASSITVA